MDLNIHWMSFKSLRLMFLLKLHICQLWPVGVFVSWLLSPFDTTYSQWLPSYLEWQDSSPHKFPVFPFFPYWDSCVSKNTEVRELDYSIITYLGYPTLHRYVWDWHSSTTLPIQLLKMVLLVLVLALSALQWLLVSFLSLSSQSHHIPCYFPWLFHYLRETDTMQALQLLMLLPHSFIF